MAMSVFSPVALQGVEVSVRRFIPFALLGVLTVGSLGAVALSTHPNGAGAAELVNVATEDVLSANAYSEEGTVTESIGPLTLHSSFNAVAVSSPRYIETHQRISAEGHTIDMTELVNGEGVYARTPKLIAQHGASAWVSLSRVSAGIVHALNSQGGLSSGVGRSTLASLKARGLSYSDGGYVFAKWRFFAPDHRVRFHAGQVRTASGRGEEYFTASEFESLKTVMKNLQIREYQLWLTPRGALKEFKIVETIPTSGMGLSGSVNIEADATIAPLSTLPKPDSPFRQ
jgi:hypothetical protein